MNLCMCEVIFTLLANPMCVSYCNTKLKNVAILCVDMLNNADLVTIVCHKCIISNLGHLMKVSQMRYVYTPFIRFSHHTLQKHGCAL